MVLLQRLLTCRPPSLAVVSVTGAVRCSDYDDDTVTAALVTEEVGAIVKVGVLVQEMVTARSSGR